MFHQPKSFWVDPLSHVAITPWHNHGDKAWPLFANTSKTNRRSKKGFELEVSTLGIGFNQPMTRTNQHPIETETVAIRPTSKRYSPADFVRFHMLLCYKIKMESDEDEDL